VPNNKGASGEMHLYILTKPNPGFIVEGKFFKTDTLFAADCKAIF
jgi:hypothetical protein